MFLEYFVIGVALALGALAVSALVKVVKYLLKTFDRRFRHR